MFVETFSAKSLRKNYEKQKKISRGFGVLSRGFGVLSHGFGVLSSGLGT